MRLVIQENPEFGTSFYHESASGARTFLAYVSAKAGKVNWFVEPSNLPFYTKRKIENKGKKLRREFYKHLDAMDEASRYKFLLESIPEICVDFVENRSDWSVGRKIDYMCNVLETKTSWG